MTIAGIVIGFIVILFIPLPRCHLLGALAAVSCLVIGANFNAFSSFDRGDSTVPSWVPAGGGGLLMGIAIGYFANWIRAAYKAEQIDAD